MKLVNLIDWYDIPDTNYRIVVSTYTNTPAILYEIYETDNMNFREKLLMAHLDMLADLVSRDLFVKEFGNIAFMSFIYRSFFKDTLENERR